jgi:hypothetical protein
MSNRKDLLARAVTLQLTHPKNISVKDLKAMIAEAEAAQNTKDVPAGDDQSELPKDATTDAAQTGGPAATTVPAVTTATKAATKAPDVSGRALRITGPKKGRRRAGYEFGAVAVEILLADLSEEQMAQLFADPTLVVQLFEDGAEIAFASGGTVAAGTFE